MAAVTILSDFGAQENKVCHCFHYSPSICHDMLESMGSQRIGHDLALNTVSHEVMGPDAMILVF